ncbi:protein prenyltransferase alpha subunit repeat-containing protein 1 isoform X2 [Cryptotermes secundus]|uniref:protein prenyltransferase alpha subunit repeat-containing protein 1 isoform X2 n=1 Tax=Cryptotermes secundus TaxID=105785 RepID=UPI000CD7CC37|nr:protein prenyltransferase alpha subunit repeat-containing protein 1 isoform X2 [Cryptotermes secundus]
MQDDPFPAAERILSEIETVFKKDPKLKEFDIVPVTVNHNKSPVLHVEHCLGLESWCVRHVYCYTYRRLMDARHLRNRREGALLLNPDVTTFWNMRRELLQASRLDMQGELHFTAVLLSRKPKCAEAFAHRKWVVKRLLLADADKDELLEKELQVSQYAADRYPNNYHAWSHRMWCLTHLASFASAPLLKEWSSSEAWVSSHVSDHSGLQYRQFLLNHLLELKQFVSDDVTEKARKSILQFLSCSWSEDTIDTVQSALIKAVGLIASELLLNTDLILRFAGHEALWCHRRYLLMSFKKFLTSRRADMNGIGGCRCSKVSAIRNRCAEKSSEGVSALNKDKPSNHMNVDGVPLEKDQKLSSEELAALDRYLCNLQGAMIWHEVKLISNCRPDELHQQRLAKQHHKWLSHVLKLDIPAVTCHN